MFSAWAKFPPIGLYNGATSDAGSYLGCLTVPPNSVINHTHYCSLQYRPLIMRPRLFRWTLLKKGQVHSSNWPGNAALDETVNALDHWLLRGLVESSVDLEWGTCFPIGCSPNDVKQIARHFSGQIYFKTVFVRCNSIYEQDYFSPQQSGSLSISTEDVNDGIFIWKPHMIQAQFVSLYIISFLVCVIVFWTLMDIALVRLPPLFGLDLSPRSLNLEAPATSSNDLSGQNANTSPRQCELKRAFFWLIENCSMINSAQRLFGVDERSNRKQILCINGIRCIFSLLIVGRHTIQHTSDYAKTSSLSFGTLMIQLAQDPNLVETFFVVSGFVQSASVFKNSKVGQQDVDNKLQIISIPTSILNRYLRFIPQVLLATALTILSPLLSSRGSSRWFRNTGQELRFCTESWWAQIFYLQAFIQPKCNDVTWYLTSDMGLYLLGLIITLVGSNLGRRGVKFSCLLVLILVVAAHIINNYRNFFSKDKFDYHFNPISHVIPYLIGFYPGFIWATDRTKISSWLSRKWALFGWLLIIAMKILESFLIFYGIYGGLSPDNVEIIEHSERLIVSLTTIWTILVCVAGYGGWINQLLSCKLFIVLARISFNIYLTHLVVVTAMAGLTETIHWQRQPLLSVLVIGTIFVSTTMATLICIVFEQPWLQLHKKIMKCIK